MSEHELLFEQYSIVKRESVPLEENIYSETQNAVLSELRDSLSIEFALETELIEFMSTLSLRIIGFIDSETSVDL